MTIEHVAKELIFVGDEFLSLTTLIFSLSDPLNDKFYCRKCYPSKLPDVTRAGNAEYVIPRGCNLLFV
jgi:hypothetical protein